MLCLCCMGERSVAREEEEERNEERGHFVVVRRGACVGVYRTNSLLCVGGTRNTFCQVDIFSQESHSMEMKSKIYKRWDSILGDLLAICSSEITTKFRKN